MRQAPSGGLQIRMRQPAVLCTEVGADPELHIPKVRVRHSIALRALCCTVWRSTAVSRVSPPSAQPEQPPRCRSSGAWAIGWTSISLHRCINTASKAQHSECSARSLSRCTATNRLLLCEMMQPSVLQSDIFKREGLPSEMSLIRQSLVRCIRMGRVRRRLKQRHVRGL